MGLWQIVQLFFFSSRAARKEKMCEACEDTNQAVLVNKLILLIFLTI